MFIICIIMISTLAKLGKIVIILITELIVSIRLIIAITIIFLVIKMLTVIIIISKLYKLGGELGKGGFGVVYAAVRRADKLQVVRMIS